MKKLALLALLSALSGIVSAQESGPAVVQISGSDANHYAIQNSRYMNAAEFQKFERTYELSNGQTLSLFNRSDVLYAKVDEGSWHHIVATGADTFISRDKELKMTIDLKDDGQVGGELLMPASPHWVASDEHSDPHFMKVVFR